MNRYQTQSVLDSYVLRAVQIGMETKLCGVKRSYDSLSTSESKIDIIEPPVYKL